MATHTYLSDLKKDLGISGNSEDDTLNIYLSSAEEDIKTLLNTEDDLTANAQYKVCVMVKAKGLYDVAEWERYQKVYDSNLKTLGYNLQAKTFKARKDAKS